MSRIPIRARLTAWSVVAVAVILTGLGVFVVTRLRADLTSELDRNLRSEAAQIALHYLGVPYVWGGSTPSGFDCSGLVMYVYAQLGISLPHYTVAQWNATLPISTSEMQPGDLVFFDGLGHVGIYIGGGQFVHAPHTGTVVQVASLSGYYASNLVGARRVP